MPHTLRQVDRAGEVLSALKVLAGFDADLSLECTRAINWLRGLLLQIFPALERVFQETRITRPLVLELSIPYGGPTGLRAVGKGNVLRFARNHSRKDPSGLIEEIFTAPAEQTVTVAGTAAVEIVVPRVVAQIKELKAQRAILAKEVEKLVDDFPLSTVLISMPGVGIKTAATVLLAIGDGTGFKDAAHLAAYAGIAPTSRYSGTSIHGEHPSRSGYKAWKDALFRSAWVASCHAPISMAYYQRKRAEGKKHNAAVMCLARRRCDVLYSMIKNGTLYAEKTTVAA